MSWHTKEDILDDLAEVMGNGMNDFDEQYIVRGEQPPPACVSNELDDDELYLRIHGEVGDKTMSEVFKSPDLSGITEMLRMVDKFHSSNNTGDDQVSTQNSSGTEISIIKMDVGAPELVPKIYVKHENTKVDSLCSEQTMDEAKIKEISDKLKSKIGASSKTSNLKGKRERNLAIASLLKLHSKENSNANETTPKLITPEHFQIHSSANLNDKSSQSFSKKLTTARPLLQVENVESPIDITEEANDMNHELEESVAKVNSWLNSGSEKAKLETRGPALYLGPVTFRKKERKKPITPSSEVSDVSTRRMMDNSFVPSEYADKLTQSYMERVKANEDKSLDIWGKLERDLKVKDKEILSNCSHSSKQSTQEKSNGSQR